MLATAYYTTRNTDLALVGMLVIVTVALVLQKLFLARKLRKCRRQEKIDAFYSSRSRQLSGLYLTRAPLDHQRAWPGWLD